MFGASADRTAAAALLAAHYIEPETLLDGRNVERAAPYP
jgi:hypothetical protein